MCEVITLRSNRTCHRPIAIFDWLSPSQKHYSFCTSETELRDVLVVVR